MGQVRNEKLLMAIALRIKSLREAKGLTQEDIYNTTDIHIARIETAKVNISVSTLSKICDKLEISLTDFFLDLTY